MPKAVDRLLVAEPLDAQPLQLGLELLHALLACGHLAAELLQLATQILQPRRLGVESAEDALQPPAPHRRSGRPTVRDVVRNGGAAAAPVWGRSLERVLSAFD